MEHEATINARMPEALKRGGTRVLDEQGVSPTQIIRKLYSYMEREGRIPECLEDSANGTQDLFETRRSLARRIAGTITLSGTLDVAAERASRIEEKYGSLL